MSRTATTAAAGVQLRTVPISAIVPIDAGTRAARLTTPSCALVGEHARAWLPGAGARPGHRGRRLSARRRRERYKAAVLAALMELPAIVRPTDARKDTAGVEAELLVDAVVANQLRSQLAAVEEALACRRLKVEHGLTVKGIAQKLQMTRARVRERLQVLDLPEVLWPRIGAGEIPASAIPGLVGLEKLHPGLAAVAVTLVLDRGPRRTASA